MEYSAADDHLLYIMLSYQYLGHTQGQVGYRSYASAAGMSYLLYPNRQVRLSPGVVKMELGWLRRERNPDADRLMVDFRVKRSSTRESLCPSAGEFERMLNVSIFAQEELRANPLELPRFVFTNETGKMLFACWFRDNAETLRRYRQQLARALSDASSDPNVLLRKTERGGLRSVKSIVKQQMFRGSWDLWNGMMHSGWLSLENLYAQSAREFFRSLLAPFNLQEKSVLLGDKEFAATWH